MDHQELFKASLPLIERLVAFVGKRYGLSRPDTEDLASCVKLKLVEHDYAILRRFEGKSSLTTYLSVVVHRTLFDERARTSGRWRPSARARRIGEPGILLESLTGRDGIPPTEAMERVQTQYPEVQREELENLLAQQKSEGSPDLATFTQNQSPPPDRVFEQKEADQLSRRIHRTLAGAVETWSAEDRLIVRMRFAQGLSVATIARVMNLDQKALYKRLDRRFEALRRALEQDGIAQSELQTILREASALNLDLSEVLRGPQESGDVA